MSKEDLEEFRAPASSHDEFRDRVRKTLYYGQYSDRSLPSLAVTDVAVEVLSSVVPTKRKCLDTSYAMVVSRRAKISPCTIMMGILYSERLHQKNPEYLRRVSSSDLFLISMMVASKYLYDEGEDEEVFNDDWAKAGKKLTFSLEKWHQKLIASGGTYQG
ncbi:Cyclin-dependent protein kinase [Desmophyllum pertusum]|uniref:Protein CNPPD1 n=1 Tax=Desmophyllum pertusum TaxID=174260 RepID=A0A9X0D7C6_9CNID|nr:Cyclin-dependent protein kinase [Desmophyllum pertusum]